MQWQWWAVTEDCKESNNRLCPRLTLSTPTLYVHKVKKERKKVVGCLLATSRLNSACRRLTSPTHSNWKVLVTHRCWWVGGWGRRRRSAAHSLYLVPSLPLYYSCLSLLPSFRLALSALQLLLRKLHGGEEPARGSLPCDIRIPTFQVLEAQLLFWPPGSEKSRLWPFQLKESHRVRSSLPEPSRRVRIPFLPDLSCVSVKSLLLLCMNSSSLILFFLWVAQLLDRSFFFSYKMESFLLFSFFFYIPSSS